MLEATYYRAKVEMLISNYVQNELIRASFYIILFSTSLPLEFAIEISLLVSCYAPVLDSLSNKFCTRNVSLDVCVCVGGGRYVLRAEDLTTVMCHLS